MTTTFMTNYSKGIRRKRRNKGTAREKLGIGQDHWANMLGISQSLLSKYEHGERSLPMEATKKLAVLTIALDRVQRSAAEGKISPHYPLPAGKLAEANKEMESRLLLCHYDKIILQRELNDMTAAYESARLLLLVLDEMRSTTIKGILKVDIDNDWETHQILLAIKKLSDCGEMARAKLEAKIAMLEAEAAVYERMAGRFKQD